jgi:flagellar M-ring protein FliF
MPEQFKKYIDPVQSRWNALTRPQQYKLVGVVLAVLLAVILVLFILFRPRWTVLFHDRDFFEVSHMQIVLDAQGIRNDNFNNGRGLRVDTRRAEEAIVTIERSGTAPQDERFNWPDVWANSGLSTTESQRRHMANLAQEGSLETILETNPNITRAFVTLNVPDPVRLFTPNMPPASASVTLVVRTRHQFSQHEGREMALQVARAVQGLDISQVHIMDNYARSIFNGEEDIINDPLGSIEQARSQHRNLVYMDLRDTMRLMFNDSSVSFNPVFDSTHFTESVVNEHFLPAGQDLGLIVVEDRQRSRVQGRDVSLEPGLQWNTAGTPGYAMPGGGATEAENRHDQIERVVNHSITQSRTGAGWVVQEQSTAAVTGLIAVPVRQDHWMAQDETRTNADWLHFTDNNARARTVDPSSFENFDGILATIAAITNLPVENTTLTILEQYYFIHTQGIPLVNRLPMLIMLAVFFLLLLLLALFLLRNRAQADEKEEEIEPALSIEQMLVSTRLDEAREEEMAAMDEINYFKENEIKKQIEKFVNEKPEAVASLLRGWINMEEW